MAVCLRRQCAVSTVTLNQWRTQDFRMGGVEILQAPRGWDVGRGVYPPHWGKSLGRGLSPEIFSYFLFIIPYFDAFWHVCFLNNTPMGGVLTPLTPSSVRYCLTSTFWLRKLSRDASLLIRREVVFRCRADNARDARKQAQTHEQNRNVTRPTTSSASEANKSILCINGTH